MNVIERLKAVAGEDFNSRECRVTNPRITARESIEIADYIVQIERQNQELAAQVEALSKLHSDLTNADMVFEDDAHSGYLITTEQIDEMEHLLATPAACLAHVRAEAGRAGFVAGAEWWAKCELEDTLHLDEQSAANQYAESIRQEVN
jgi:hypothetical protein